MIQLTHDLQRKCDLLWLLTHKEVALKYKRTLLGIFWSLLNPILLCLVFLVAFKIFMRFEMENYVFFLLSALFPWTWFSSSVLISGRSLIDNISLVKKVIFPRHYLVACVILSQLLHFILSIPILLILSFTHGSGPSWTWFVGVPLIMGIQCLLTFGLCLVVAILNTYFRDAEYLVGVVMNLFFWMTPVIYPLSSIPEEMRSLFLLNPLTGLLIAWRQLFLYNQLVWDKIGIAFLISILFVVLGNVVFKRMERRLDEVL